MTEPTPICDQLLAEHRRRTLTVVPACRPTPTRLAILNNGTGLHGAVTWNA